VAVSARTSFIIVIRDQPPPPPPPRSTASHSKRQPHPSAARRRVAHTCLATRQPGRIISTRLRVALPLRHVPSTAQAGRTREPSTHWSADTLREHEDELESRQHLRTLFESMRANSKAADTLRTNSLSFRWLNAPRNGGGDRVESVEASLLTHAVGHDAQVIRDRYEALLLLEDTSVASLFLAVVGYCEDRASGEASSSTLSLRLKGRLSSS
jgi:hypothetical protein